MDTLLFPPELPASLCKLQGNRGCKTRSQPWGGVRGHQLLIAGVWGRASRMKCLGHPGLRAGAPWSTLGVSGSSERLTDTQASSGGQEEGDASQEAGGTQAGLRTE